MPRARFTGRPRNARRRLVAAVEALEVRRLLSSVTGHVFVDPNPADPTASHAWAGGGQPLGGMQVYLDSNRDGQFDSGDPSTTTNSDGSFTLDNLPADVNNLLRAVVPADGGMSPYWLSRSP